MNFDARGAFALAVLTAVFVCGPAASADEPAPQAAAPAASEAPVSTKNDIKPGDTLKITVYREGDLSGDFVVDSNGLISYPLVGTLKVAGRKTNDIREDIVVALKKYIIEPQVTISHQPKKEEKSAQGANSAESLTVLGEVRNAGSYDATADLTLTQVIAECGGFTPLAEPSKIKIIRMDKGHQMVFFYSMDKINNAEIDDPKVFPGDKVVVPAQEKDTNAAAILGEVKNAGMYEVTPGFTLMRLIAKAGGFTPVASTSKIRVVREESGKKQILVFNAGTIIGGQADDPEIKPGDMVFVPESFF